MTLREGSTDGMLAEVLGRLQVVKGPDQRGEYIAWCPFHSDGQGKAPHQPNLNVSERGFCCHACGQKGSLGTLAKRLGRDTGTPEPETVYDYKDEEGKLLFQVVRRPGKRFRQRRPDGAGGWTWNLNGVRRVLYRLPELLASDGQPAWLPEGEKDVDNLAARGLTATTNPSGALKWRGEYSQFLKGRDVIILPDNDEPGRTHAQMVARSLNGVARSVKVVELPGLSEKGDVSDWFADGHSVEDLQALAERVAPWKPTRSAAPRADAEGPTGQSHETHAAALARLAMERCVELFHDQRGEPQAVVPLPEGRKILAIGSRQFSWWLGELAWKELGLAPSQEIIRTACLTVGASARFDGQEHALHVRSAWHNGCIWLDMDGSRAVRVKPGKWDIVAEPPVLFRSFAHQLPLAGPVRGGDLREVLRFVNLRGEDDKLLFPCYLVAAQVPDVPIVSLVVHGVQGAAKSSLLKVVKRLLDPSRVELRGGAANQEEFALAASQNRVLFLDNITSMPDWLSDALCRAVTGDGWSKRTLYTDEDSTILEYQGVVGVAGINLVADRPDLLDRSLILALEPLSAADRQPEETFWAEFGRARPRLLGALLDALAKAMEIRPTLMARDLPRMADFALWGAAAAEALGARAASFLSAYKVNVSRQNDAAVEASPVAQAILEMMAGRTEWQGSPTELLAELQDVAVVLRLDTRCKEWPKSASWVGRRVNEVAQNLLALGIRAKPDRCGTRRWVAITKVSEDAVTADIDVAKAKESAEEALSGDDSAAHAVIDAVTANAPPAGASEPRDNSDSNDGNPRQSRDLSEPGALFPWCDDYAERKAVMIEGGDLSEEEASLLAGAEVMRAFGWTTTGA